MKIFSSRSGFTLIELMVTISIMALLFGIGLAGYQQFNQSRKVIEAAKTLRSDLNFARSKALAGDKSSCSGGSALNGWSIRALGGSSYDLICFCGGVGSVIKTVDLGGITVSLAEVLFRPLALGVSSAATFTLSQGSYQEVVTVSQSGEIN